MKIIRLLIAAAVIAALLGSCRSAPCRGYGELKSDNQPIEQRA